MLPNVTATTGGMYTCVVTNIAGSNNASTFVFIFPYFINHPHSDEVSVGSAVVLICDAVSFPSPDYLWQRSDGGNISSDTVINERNLSISRVEYGDEGGYFCNALVGEDSVQSQIAIVTGNYAVHSISYLADLHWCKCHGQIMGKQAPPPPPPPLWRWNIFAAPTG